jgi:hypothetical protein
VASSTASVTGNKRYASPDETLTSMGDYWWQATYGGDDSNNSASTPCADGAVTATTASPELTSETPLGLPAVVGGPVGDQVTLEDGYSPGGTLTFDIYDSDDCTGTTVFTQQSTVDGDQNCGVSFVNLTEAGSYWWEVTYSGDANNEPASTPCTDDAFTLAQASPELSSETPSPTQAVVASSFGDTVTLADGYRQRE